MRLVMAVLAASAGMACGQFSDDFESYPVGTDLHGLNGWTGWENSPSATAFTTDVQASSGTKSVLINSTSDLVHMFTSNPQNKYTFRVKMYMTSTGLGEPYFILLNDYQNVAGYQHHWATQVRFRRNAPPPAPANVAYDNMEYGLNDQILGLVPGFTPREIRMDQWVEVRVEIDLCANNQKMYYNNEILMDTTWQRDDGTGNFGPAAIAAVDLYGNTSDGTYFDDVSFTDDGPGNCPSPCAVVDLNSDNTVDFNDYLEFLNLYNALDLRVDFNADGTVDFNDYLEFLNLYNGCQ